MFHNHKFDLIQAIRVISYAHTSRFSQPPGISYCRIELGGGAIEEEFPLSRKMGWMSSIPLCVLSFCSCWPTCSHTCSVWDPNHPKHTQLSFEDFHSPWSLSDSSVCPYPSSGVKEFFETIGRWKEFPHYLHLAWPLANFFWVAPPFKDARRSPILGKTCKRRSVLKPDLCGITWLTQKESGIKEREQARNQKGSQAKGP